MSVQAHLAVTRNVALVKRRPAKSYILSSIMISMLLSECRSTLPQLNGTSSVNLNAQERRRFRVWLDSISDGTRCAISDAYFCSMLKSNGLTPDYSWICESSKTNVPFRFKGCTRESRVQRCHKQHQHLPTLYSQLIVHVPTAILEGPPKLCLLLVNTMA